MLPRETSPLSWILHDTFTGSCLLDLWPLCLRVNARLQDQPSIDLIAVCSAETDTWGYLPLAHEMAWGLPPLPLGAVMQTGI